ARGLPCIVLERDKFDSFLEGVQRPAAGAVFYDGRGGTQHFKQLVAQGHNFLMSLGFFDLHGTAMDLPLIFYLTDSFIAGVNRPPDGLYYFACVTCPALLDAVKVAACFTEQIPQHDFPGGFTLALELLVHFSDSLLVLFSY